MRQEVDRIIAQMMHAAEYLGWDVSELRPVSAATLCCISYSRGGGANPALQGRIPARFCILPGRNCWQPLG